MIDRKSNMLKLAAGEFVAPASLEPVYAAHCGLARQVFVHGEMGAAFLVAVVAVDHAAVRAWAAEDGRGAIFGACASIDELVSSAALRQAVLAQLRLSARPAKTAFTPWSGCARLALSRAILVGRQRATLSLQQERARACAVWR